MCQMLKVKAFIVTKNKDFTKGVGNVSLCVSHFFKLQETLDVELEDLEVTATLGVGGFGRVELVQVNPEYK
jgi:hypothetical protein